MMVYDLEDAMEKLRELAPSLNDEYKEAIGMVSDAYEYIGNVQGGVGFIQMQLCDSNLFIELGDDKKKGKTLVDYVEIDGKEYTDGTEV